MLKLYAAPKTRSFRPRWLLEEMGVPYDTVNLDLAAGEHKKSDYRAIHPLGKVPALQDGTTTLFESAAICAYLADKFPEKRMAPAPQSNDRAHYFQWLFYAVATLEELVSQVSQHRGKPEADKPTELFRERLEPIEDWMRSRKHLLGDPFYACDVVLGAVLLWAQALQLLEDAPNTKAYLGRLRERPAYRRARQE